MKFLFAVKSCEYDRQRGAHDLIRATWGRHVHPRFFLGGGRAMAEDEVLILAPDDYASLPWKTREIVRWGIRENYDFIFLCDTGSFVIPHHLAECGFEKYDYSGYWCMKSGTFPYTARSEQPNCPTTEIPVCYPWASGGGYILSRKAMEIVAASTPSVWAEDMWVGQALASRGVLLHDLAPEGFKGFVVDWIHDEDNTGSLHNRSVWMQAKYEDGQFRCMAGCDYWQEDLIQRFVLRDDPVGRRSEHERILRERQEQRTRMKK